MKVSEGSVIHITYTLKLEDGRVVDKTLEGKPLVFKVGEGAVLPGLEKAVMGMGLEEEKTFTLSSDEAYGLWRPELKMAYARIMVPDGLEPQKGEIFPVDLGSGEKIPAKVVSVDEKAVVLDANHPLAGKDLVFEVKVVGIE